MTKITETEFLALIEADAREFETNSKEAETDDLDFLEREIEQWLTEIKEALPLTLSERAQPSLQIAEAALAKVKRRKPVAKSWKGKEVEPDAIPEPPPPPPPEPAPPILQQSSEQNPQPITKV
jgi:hypothetical protein